MFADLHIHSTFSDSTRTPEEIVRVAKDNRISLLSICDHATIDSYERFIKACTSEGLSYILGIELGAVLNGEGFDVLVYNFDIHNEDMLNLIKHQQSIIDMECEAMIGKMSKDYPQISISDYRAFSYPVEQGGWKYLHYAVAKGVFKTYDEAGQIIFPMYYEVVAGTHQIDEFCKIVKQANGIPVLAHPGNADSEVLTVLFREMQENGVEGIECYYPSHSKCTTETCVEYCQKNNLRITSGSDCHGDYDKTEGYRIGSFKTPLESLSLKGMI
jgi:predicted metal-dependent phosphoesterase TrpH